MVSVMEEGPFRLRILAAEDEENSSSSNPTAAVIFVGISLVLGIPSRHILRGTRVPYTVALLVLGIGLGSLDWMPRLLVSVRSEGSATVRKSPDMGELKRPTPILSRHSSSRKDSRHMDYSSDESGGEDEHIV